MEINIISYTAQQLAELSTEQILEVRSAQTKKESLEAKLEKALEDERARLVQNGMLHSDVWALTQEKLRAECEAEIDRIRERLLFYLHYSAQEEHGTPYPVDYSLGWEDRCRVVMDYYLAAYIYAEERFEAFKGDAVAKKYIGEYYSIIYNYFWKLVQDEKEGQVTSVSENLEQVDGANEPEDLGAV